MPGGAQTKVAPHGLAPRGIPGCRASDQRPDERGGAGTAQGRAGRSRRPGAAGVPAAPAPRPRRPTTCSNRPLSELARIGLCSSFLTRTGLLSSVRPSLRFPVRASVRPSLQFSTCPSLHSSVLCPPTHPSDSCSNGEPLPQGDGDTGQIRPLPCRAPAFASNDWTSAPSVQTPGACPGVRDSAGAL